MPTSTPLPRRSLLKLLGAAAGGAVAAPLLPPLELFAQSMPPPRRLVFFFNSNGTWRPNWLPTMGPAGLQLSPILQPLAPFASRLLVIDGLGYNVTQVSGIGGHFGGMNSLLTGSVPRIVDPNDPDHYTLATGISVDQRIANAIGASTAFRSVQCGVQVDLHPTCGASSYAGPMSPLVPENSPYLVYRRLFGSFMPPGTTDLAAQQRLADRRSVLDFVHGDIARLQSRLGSADRRRVDAHLTALREIENRLAPTMPPTSLAACRMPTVGAPELPIYANDNIPALGRLQTDLLVMALACDLTRVGTIQHGRAGANHQFTWLGFTTNPDNGPNDMTTGIHALAHNLPDAMSADRLSQCNRWYAGELAYLLGRLQSVPEGAGTMLDHTLVVWCNELGQGNTHAVTNTPWVLAGNVDGYFRTGRVVAYPGQAHNRLLLSLCQAFGLPDTVFGHPDFGSQPLTGLT